MRLPEICIRHPVLAIVLNLVLIVLGVVGYQRLEMRYFPEMDVPMITISTHYEGASSQLIESSITTPIENALGGVRNVQSISSSSSSSWSTIVVRFRMGGNFEQELSDVRDKVSSVHQHLPPDAEASTFSVGTNGEALLTLGFLDKKKTSAQIRDYVENFVRPIIREVPGVGSIDIHGASNYAMRIWLNPDKMTKLGVTVTDIQTALESNNIDFPAGSVRDPNRNFTVISKTRLTTAKQFANIIIANVDNHFIRLGDVAKVELGYQSLQDYPMHINGQSGIAVEIKPLQGANPITIATKIKGIMKRVEKKLPPGMHAEILYDQSTFLKQSIHETFMTILEAVLLVVIVVFLFLGSIRASTIPIITIPFCLIASFGVMYLLGFSINIMTLLALVLAIGLVVDDAIVVLENIHRHIENGLSPFAAAIKGSKEIGYAVIAMTITLAAVYAPIGFSQGFTSIIFKEFAFTLAAAVIISGFVALTLSPMMCSKVLRSDDGQRGFTHFIDALFEKLSNAYQGTLAKIIKARLLIVVIVLALALFGYFLFKLLPSEFVPKEDTGLINISVQSPPGASIEYTGRNMEALEKIYATINAIQNYYTIIWTGSARSGVVLKPWDKRKASIDDVLKELKQYITKIPGIDAYPSIPDPVDYGVQGSDLVMQIMTIGNYKDLDTTMQKLVAAAKKWPGMSHVQSSLKFDDQQYAVHIKRDLAAELGISLQAIADTMRVMLGGAHITDVNAEGQIFEVLVQMNKFNLENFRGFKKLYVKSSIIPTVPAGAPPATAPMIPLSSLITLTPIIGQPSLKHFNRMRAAALTANINPGYTIGEAVHYLEKVAPPLLNKDQRYGFDGKAEQFLNSEGSMLGIFLMALIFIYLVLSAQFGSFIDPFIILLSVPLSIVGALFTLKLAGGTMNLYSEIGLVTLVGMISKHGILITQFTNDLRKQGIELSEAIVKASATRLRPILMTTSAMVIGTVPLALAEGPGSVGRSQIGWIIVGGLLFGTFFSLIVVPVAYSYLGKLKRFDKQVQ